MKCASSGESDSGRGGYCGVLQLGLLLAIRVRRSGRIAGSERPITGNAAMAASSLSRSAGRWFRSVVLPKTVPQAERSECRDFLDRHRCRPAPDSSGSTLTLSGIEPKESVTMRQSRGPGCVLFLIIEN